MKTDKRNRMDVNTTLDNKMRCVELGPTDPKEISKLVDRATQGRLCGVSSLGMAPPLTRAMELQLRLCVRRFRI